MKATINRDYIINLLQQQKPFLEKKFGLKKIALFGSYARNEARLDSDIDILIETNQKSFDNLFDIQEYLKITLHRKVDVGYFDNVRPFMMRFIKEDLIYA